MWTDMTLAALILFLQFLPTSFWNPFLSILLHAPSIILINLSSFPPLLVYANLLLKLFFSL